MTITKIQANSERKLVTNLITSTRFCKEVLPLLKTMYLETGFAKEVVKWIMEYYAQFETAPGRDIKTIYHAKKANINDEEIETEVSTFLASISKDYEKLEANNLDFEIHAAIVHLKIRSLEVLSNALEDSILENNPEKGEQALSNFKRVERSFGQGVSLLHDAQKITDAFCETDEFLYALPGALGLVAGKANRGDFWSFLAPMKRGKTWYLWYIAETALHNSLKVIFFTLEMTEKAMIRRTWKSLVGQPTEKGMISIPYFTRESEDEKWSVEEKEEEREGIDASNIAVLQKKFRRKFRKGDVRIISLPSKSATVADLNTHLDNMMHYENFIPDVIIIDYADILAPPKNMKEYRHGLDDIWASLRRMAQERNCQVVTASQTEKGTFNKDINEGSASEDVRKIAHITCGLALNQTKVERNKGVMRIAQVVTREEKHAPQQAVVLQCLDIGRPCIESRLQNEVKYITNDEENEYKENDEKRGYSRKK